jgi:hypothetical protein
LGERWAQLGLMEHASIAAFARFALQLLHVGAPLAQLVACQRALLDETQHARACFGLASAYLGQSVGPGPLPTEDALSDISLASILRLTIREGCVGETVAALEAATGRDACQEPVTRLVLAQIQADEARHAELAWRFVQWAFECGSAETRALIAAEFDALLREPLPAEHDSFAESGFDPLPYGIVPPTLRTQLRAAALRDVVAPCAQALLRPPTRDAVRTLHAS